MRRSEIDGISPVPEAEGKKAGIIRIILKKEKKGETRTKNCVIGCERLGLSNTPRHQIILLLTADNSDNRKTSSSERREQGPRRFG